MPELGPGPAGAIVLVRDEGPVRVITLNRPERNALDIPLRVRLAGASRRPWATTAYG